MTDAGRGVPRDAAGQDDDGGPMDCNTQGTWSVTLDSSSEPCSPLVRDRMLTIDVDSDAGVDDFVTSNEPSGPFCTPEPRITRKVDVAASGCTVNATSLTSWCANGEPQCTEYQLKLHVRGDRADIEGRYRHCWCRTSGPEGTTVQVKGTAVRL